MKIIMVGGHLSPAMSVYQSLPKDTDVLFIGRKHALEGDLAVSLEYQDITSHNIPFVNLPAGRLQRKFTRHTLPSLFKLPSGFFKAFKTLTKYKPDIVLCFGGYLQIPVAVSAYLLGIPVIIHEQTTKSGLANKIITPLAKTICISWSESARFFPKSKTILTGLPLRKEFYMSLRGGSLKATKLIYITGGSLGAHAINALVEGTLAKLLEKFYVVHQTGGAKEYNDFERLEKIRIQLPASLRAKYKLIKFVDPKNVADIMNSADLVISRSGINTVSELMYLKKPCLLIPLPHGQAGEQLENARLIEKRGLGKILSQEELTPEILYSQIMQFAGKLNQEKIKTSKEKYPDYDAASKIVQIIIQIYRQKSTQKK